MDNLQSKKRDTERTYLLEVIRSLRYLGRQGIALQGRHWNDSFTQLLRLLSTNKKSILYHLEGKIEHKCTHNDVQNEISDIMAVLTLQEKLKTIRQRRFFSMIADKGTDVSNKEQLSFCPRSVDESLNAFKDFKGFYQVIPLCI